MNKKVLIFTDGSCYNKTKQGGFGVYMQFKDGLHVIAEKKISKGYSNTTISRMELRAIIVALRNIKIKTAYPILLVSDSEYTINSINKGWLLNWEREGFVGRKNSDLWKEFLRIWRTFPQNQIKFIHTRGHSKGKDVFQYGNDMADSLASFRNFTDFELDQIDYGTI